LEQQRLRGFSEEVASTKKEQQQDE